MAVLIDGRAAAAQLRSDIATRVSASGIRPGLAVIVAGNDPASAIYVNNKHRACEEVGIYSEICRLDESVTESELLAIIDGYNKREDIHGILVQLPLPSGLDDSRAILAIDPKKDVDAFHPVNVGRVMTGDYSFAPCTPSGIMYLLRRYGVDVCGKNCVVIGRSNIVGKPMAMLLLHANATVTVCHSRTKGLADICCRADILISAVGKAGFVTADMVMPGAVVIDVGINRSANGKAVGDVDFAAVEPIAGMITPVPGGVGPMTVAMLLENTLRAAECLTTV